MLKKVFTKKIIKVIPIWLVLVILISGSAAATVVINYISNPIKTSVTVNSQYITISGAFTTPVTAYADVTEDFTYTLNGVTSTTGDIILTFTNPNGAFVYADRAKFEVSSLRVETDGDNPVMNNGFQIQYAGDDGYGNIIIVIAKTGGDPFTFQTTSSNHIIVGLIYQMSGPINARIQVRV